MQLNRGVARVQTSKPIYIASELPLWRMGIVVQFNFIPFPDGNEIRGPENVRVKILWKQCANQNGAREKKHTTNAFNYNDYCS